MFLFVANVASFALQKLTMLSVSNVNTKVEALVIRLLAASSTCRRLVVSGLCHALVLLLGSLAVRIEVVQAMKAAQLSLG